MNAKPCYSPLSKATESSGIIRLILCALILIIVPNNSRSVFAGFENVSKSQDTGISSMPANVETLPDNLPPDVKKLHEKLREGRELFSTTDALKIFDEVISEVESIACKSLKFKPSLKFIGRRELAAILQEEITEQLESLSGSMAPEVIENQARQIAACMTPVMLAKYGFRDKTLYLLPRNFEPLFNLLDIDSKQIDPVLTLIIAHETVHALQDQHYGILETACAAKSQEAMMAFNSVIEGHAVLIAEKVGSARNLAEAIIATSRMFSAGAIQFDDPALEILNKMLSTQYESIYLGGRNFMAYHYDRSGAESLWAFIDNPPDNTSVIMRPENYTPERKARPDYGSIFKKLDLGMDMQNVQMRNEELGLMNLNAAYANMEQAMREKILQAIKYAHTMVAVNEKDKQVFNITMMMFDNSQSASSAVELLEKMALDNFAAIKDSPMVSVSDVILRDVASITADVARYLSTNITVRGESMTQQVYRIVKDGILWEILLVNLSRTDRDIALLAETLSDNLKTLETGTSVQ